MAHKPLAGKKGWKIAGELFPQADPLPALELYPQALEKVWPLREKHKSDLPADIRELSRILTCERGLLGEHYWNQPRFISAYLYYFLPWNLVRLTRLLPGLPICPPTGSNPQLLDGGAGPLTLALAMWLCRPEWRHSPIEVTAVDAARQPLQLGQKLFEAYAVLLRAPLWSIRTATGSIESLPRHENGQTWLITAANVLNELKTPLPQHGAEERNRLEMLLEAWEPLWLKNDAQLLFVEPGGRLGGKTIMRLREAALALGLYPQSPCAHAEQCPLLEQPKLRTWCHFICSALAAPKWLQELSRKARLFKTSLSLSPLLLGKTMNSEKKGGLPVRIISQIFSINGEICRYGCSARGLGVMPDSRDLVSGSLCMADIKATGWDRKTGAAILQPFDPGVRSRPQDAPRGGRMLHKG